MKYILYENNFFLVIEQLVKSKNVNVGNFFKNKIEEGEEQ